ncbi:uncharacterized protein LOC126372719 [Pectinophora gossypiella]|uniref:uncharacterized protein LOC126372719 n=1 Tax=Pectinophora gossypiella TaxID=13191 RepID=UPI00214E1393|nr:uncharacterized protein LOC126372719 [Pectinophora gossypiella]
MRVLLVLCLFTIIVGTFAAPAPQRHNLQSGPNDNEKPYIEEVVVESVLQVRTPTGRTSRTNTQLNLQDGSRVAEMKRS